MTWVRTTSGPVNLALDAGITDEIRAAYLHGQCAALAVELARRTGWPIVALCDPWLLEPGSVDERGIHDVAQWPPEYLAESFDHAVVLTPNGVLDVTGIHDLRQMVIKRVGIDPASVPVESDCPPGCVCTDDCCLADGSLCVYVTPDDLAYGAQIGGWPKPHMEAAAKVAEMVLAEYGQQAGWYAGVRSVQLRGRRDAGRDVAAIDR